MFLVVWINKIIIFMFLNELYINLCCSVEFFSLYFSQWTGKSNINFQHFSCLLFAHFALFHFFSSLFYFICNFIVKTNVSLIFRKYSFFVCLKFVKWGALKMIIGSCLFAIYDVTLNFQFIDFRFWVSKVFFKIHLETSGI